MIKTRPKTASGFLSQTLRLSVPGILFIFISAGRTEPAATGTIIWQIGKADNQAREFALPPQDYKDFLQRDFGWPDRYYLVGRSQPGQDWPSVLPGPADAWAGSGGLAGIRTHVLNILFDLKRCPGQDNWRLVVDVLEAQSPTPPRFKVMVNGHARTLKLSPGVNEDVLKGKVQGCCEQLITVDLAPSMIRKGGNCITLTSIEGSWLVFDQVRLEGPAGAELAPPARAFIRNVKAAGYETEADGRRVQPLLVDVQQVTDSPALSVDLDGQTILSTTVESGRAILEAPMPAVTNPKASVYKVSVDGKVLRSGRINRSPGQLITPADYVDPLMGTAHSRWMIAPGPWMPFSMVKLSPDNQNTGWQAGFDPSIENVGGFSHIHEWTMSGLLMMPVTGPLVTQVGDQYHPDQGYRSRVDKAREEAAIGYYRTFLSDYGITAELTATTRASFQRYTFPTRPDARILIDLQLPAEYAYRLEGCELKKTGDRRIEGWTAQHTPNVWSHDAHQEYRVHFVIEFDRPMRAFGVWTDNKVHRDVSEWKTGKVTDAGAFAEFDTRTHQAVQVRAGISLVSVENAGLNLRTEITEPHGWEFGAVRQAQRRAWNGLLGRIKIETMDRREKVRFYTNMYRAFCRNVWSDVDGRWCDPAETIRKFTDPDAVALGCDAFWNTFWNLNQLWHLAAPEWSSRWVKSQLALYDACGWLAKGPAGMEYVPVMVAEHELGAVQLRQRGGARPHLSRRP